MKYTVYIRNNCKVCDKVLNYLESHKFNFKLVNLDSDKSDSANNIFIVPALCKNHKLLAYGQDIVNYFEKHR